MPTRKAARGAFPAIHTILIFLMEIILLIVINKVTYFIQSQFYCHIGARGTNYQTHVALFHIWNIMFASLQEASPL